MCDAAPARGHRVLPHTADLIVEAWAPDLAACVEEAIAGLISACVDGSGARVVRTHTTLIGPGDADALLLDALEEVVFVLDTSADVPVGALVTASGDELELDLRLAERSTVEPTGAGPKAISRSGLSVTTEADRVRCSFLVDV